MHFMQPCYSRVKRHMNVWVGCAGVRGEGVCGAGVRGASVRGAGVRGASGRERLRVSKTQSD